MKQNYFFGLLLFAASFVNAQTITFQDPALKAALLNPNVWAYDANSEHVLIDANSDGEIEVSEVANVVSLYINNSGITSLDGLSSFPSLQILSAMQNDFVALDATSMANLVFLDVSQNPQLSNLQVSGLQHLEMLDCRANAISQLNLVNLPELYYLDVSYNQISHLDVSGLVALRNLVATYNNMETIKMAGLENLENAYISNNNLTLVDCNGCPALLTVQFAQTDPLEVLLFKNSIDPELFVNIIGLPNLRYICVHETEVSDWQADFALAEMNVEVNTYCDFTPGTRHYTVAGTTRVDQDSDGCDASDATQPSMKFQVSQNNSPYDYQYGDQSGNYSINVFEGQSVITPILENPNYYTVSPAVLNVEFPGSSNPVNQDFCIVPNGIHNDVAISVSPVSSATPGADAVYAVSFRNKGTSVQSGSISVVFDGNKSDFASATIAPDSQTANSLIWNYSALQPSEVRNFQFALHLNSASQTPAVSVGDTFGLLANITLAGTDEYPSDNSCNFKQIIASSLVLNATACLEGETASESVIGQYVTYTARFGNQGNSIARNIVVKDVLDAEKFDIATLIPLTASHDFTTRINGNVVEFIFEDIDLPSSGANQGYVTFKIRTSGTLVAGDSFSNAVSIYMDYNFPIVTQPAITTITQLSTEKFDLANLFSIHPNPAENVLHVSKKQDVEVASVAIYDVLGRKNKDFGNAQVLDVSDLTSGVYFIRITSDKGVSSTRFVKK